MNSQSQSQKYRPGEVNMNRTEAGIRRESAILSLLFTLILVAILVIINVHWAVYGILLPSIWLSSIGFLQSSRFFCVRFGLRGRQNADINRYSPILNIVSEEAKIRDRKQAMLLMFTASVISVVATLLIAMFAQNVL